MYVLYYRSLFEKMGGGKKKVKNVPTVSFSEINIFAHLLSPWIYVLDILMAILGVIAKAYSELSQTVKYFCKTLHFRCLTGFRINLRS